MANASDTSTADPATPPAPGDTDRSGQPGIADLGILLVHGIGEQAQGETLTRFAEPIVDWMRDWLHRELAQGSLVASTPIDAMLRPPLLPAGTPAHARVLIGAAGADGREVMAAQEWLFAEAWWGPQVLIPPISSFTAWLVTRGPWLMLFHFNQRLLASPATHVGWKWLIGVPLSVVWVALSLMLTTVLIAASLLAVIPIGRVRRTVFAVLRHIAGVVGDAYGQLRSSIQRAAYQRATLDAMQWLRPRCRRLAVVAHSQGAAIAHRALQTGAPKADLLVTVGAGITKLEALRYLERLGPSDRMAAFVAPLLLLATAIVALRTRALALAGLESRIVFPAVLGVAGLALLAQVWITVRGALRHLRQQSTRLSLEESQPELRWVDIVGTHDPVPGGELVRFFDLPALDSQPIPILRSWLADHTSYWTARLSFMQVLVPRLAACAELPALMQRNPGADARLAAAQRRLKVDLFALGAARWLDLLALAPPFVVARHRVIAAVERGRALLAGGSAVDAAGGQVSPLRFIEDAIGKVEQAVRWTAGVVAGDAATWARPAVDLGVACLLLSAALAGWRRLEFAVWRAWSAGRNERALRGPTRLDGVPASVRVETRLFAALSTTLANAAMAATLLMALGVSVTWSFAPSLANEAGVYRLLGQAAAWLVTALLVFSQIAERVKEVVALRERWRSARDNITWPKLREYLSRAVEGALGLLMVWLVIDRFVSLPALPRPDIIYIGILALLRGWLTLLDGIWRRLDLAGATTRSKITTVTTPLAIGSVAGLALALSVRPVQASMILSGIVVVGCIAAGIINLALRARKASAVSRNV